jgi:hypothetical protein
MVSFHIVGPDVVKLRKGRVAEAVQVLIEHVEKLRG